MHLLTLPVMGVLLFYLPDLSSKITLFSVHLFIINIIIITGGQDYICLMIVAVEATEDDVVTNYNDDPIFFLSGAWTEEALEAS